MTEQFMPAVPGWIATVDTDTGPVDVAVVGWRVLVDRHLVEAHPLVVTDPGNAYSETSLTVRDIRPGRVTR